MFNIRYGKRYVIDGVRKQPRQDPYLAISHVRYAEKNLASVDGPEYLRTGSDGLLCNSLLSLPEC